MLLFLLLLLPQPALAHTTVVAGDVAGTWHVEPDHNPKAGEPATAWVALTKAGGEIVPFEETACQMQVFALPRNEGDAPIFQPTVEAIAAEQYDAIPGTEMIFPQPGRYDLELTCDPAQEGTFAPFTLNYEVAVAAGTRPVAASPEPASEPSAAPSSAMEPEAIATASSAESPEPTTSAGSGNWAIGLLALVGVGSWLWVSRRPR